MANNFHNRGMPNLAVEDVKDPPEFGFKNLSMYCMQNGKLNKRQIKIDFETQLKEYLKVQELNVADYFDNI